MVLFNANTEPVHFKAQEAMAQIVPYSVPDPYTFEMEEISYEKFETESSERGTKGFGEATEGFGKK